MLVRATQRGYNGSRVIEEGETFTLPKGMKFSENWMEKVDGNEAPEKVDPVDPGAGPGEGDDDVKVAIANALDQLDPENDDHWNKDGKPAMKAVEGIVGDDSITREMVENVRPEFVRPAQS